MPFEVAPAPVPSWEREPKVEGKREQEAAPKTVGLDAAFLCRLHASIAWFGGVAALFVFAAARSTIAVASFGAGLALGWALLGAQAFVVGRALRPPQPGEASAKRMAWWLTVPLKYLVVAALLGWLLREVKLAPGWLALGFGTVQFVVVAKVAGRVLSGSVKTVRQAYVDPNVKRG